jgi:hypothetical protein
MRDYTALVRQLDATLQEMQGKRHLQRRDAASQPMLPERAFRAAPSAGNLPAVIELPRYCAIYDGEMWLARYGLYGDSYKFNMGIELTPQQQNRYAPENAITLPDIFKVGAERCACCGAWTRDGSVGAVWCPAHNGGHGAFVCFGNTSPTGFFRCAASCGASGQIERGGPDPLGLIPGRRGGTGHAW